MSILNAMPMPGRVQLGSPRNQVTSEKSFEWEMAKLQLLWPGRINEQLVTFTAVSIPRRHDYNLISFTKKTMYHHDNSQITNNMTQFLGVSN